MKPFYQDRSDWTNAQWANYLGCDENFVAMVCYNLATKKYSFVVSRRIYGLQNDSRWVRWQYVDDCDTRQSALEVGIKGLIPRLELGEIAAETFNVPRATPQMLKFKGRTK